MVKFKLSELVVGSAEQDKGGLISESFHLAQVSKNEYQITALRSDHYPPEEKMLRQGIWHPFLETRKLFEIKPLLKFHISNYTMH